MNYPETCRRRTWPRNWRMTIVVKFVWIQHNQVCNRVLCVVHVFEYSLFHTVNPRMTGQKARVANPVLWAEVAKQPVSACMYTSASPSCSLSDSSPASSCQWSQLLKDISGHILPLGQNMAEGGALSFSQAKALILKQRLSADEVQKLESAPQAIFKESDKEVLFYFILLLQKFCNLNFPGFPFLSFPCFRARKTTTCCSTRWSLATSRLLMSFWSGVMSVGKMTKVHWGRNKDIIYLCFYFPKNLPHIDFPFLL